MVLVELGHYGLGGSFVTFSGWLEVAIYEERDIQTATKLSTRTCA